MSSSTAETSTRNSPRADREQTSHQESPMAHAAAEIGAGTPFVAEVEKANLHPLWDRYKRITPIQPKPLDTPFHWPWRETEALLHRSVGEVAISDIERRALIMSHPNFGQETATTGTMLG